MDPAVRQAMESGGIADITTMGRRTGLPRRIEIYFHHFEGEFVLTGRPGRKRDWEANIESNPRFTLHLKGRVKADVQVLGEPVPEKEERAALMRRALIESWNSPPDRVEARLDEWVEQAPLIKFQPAGD